MKTLKISPSTHQELTEIQTTIYREQGIKLTFNEIILALIINFNKKEKQNETK